MSMYCFQILQAFITMALLDSFLVFYFWFLSQHTIRYYYIKPNCHVLFQTIIPKVCLSIDLPNTWKPCTHHPLGNKTASCFPRFLNSLWVHSGSFSKRHSKSIFQPLQLHWGHLTKSHQRNRNRTFISILPAWSWQTSHTIFHFSCGHPPSHLL